MMQKPKLTLPGAIVAIIILSVLAYAEKNSDRWRGGSRFPDEKSRAQEPKEPSGQRPKWQDEARDRAPSGGQRSGTFDYYTLVLSWSPTHCSSPDGADDEMQCARRDGRRYAFVLHGLWPQFNRGYPESCRIDGRPWVPDDVLNGMLDIMPSRGLVIHEFKKHGTCSGLDARGYYDLSRRLFKDIEIPSRFSNPFEAQFVSPDEIVDEFTSINPDLKPEMMAVACGGPGSRLQEVRICFSTEGKPRACGENENQRKLCRSDRVHVPPVRSTGRP